MHDVLDEHFVCMEYDGTALGPLPAERYPGLAPIRRMWDINPWTRVGFGGQFVVEPEGRYLLSTGAQKPFREDNHALLFQQVVEEALARFARVRAHPRGSEAEAEEIRRLEEQLHREWRTEHFRELDPYLRTVDILEQGNELPTRFPGVFDQHEVPVRRRAAELLGRYAEENGGEGFLPGGGWEVFGEALAARLDDEDGAVRYAAAKAVLHITGQPIPADGQGMLVAAARAAWRGLAARPRHGEVPGRP